MSHLPGFPLGAIRIAAAASVARARKLAEEADTTVKEIATLEDYEARAPNDSCLKYL